MIPSDHFVKFYNEIFKFLEKKGPEELDRYYARVADRQAFFTLEAFKRDGLKGMYDYWERIRIEENCDMTHDYNDKFYHLKMNTCPSLSKVLDNDAKEIEITDDDDEDINATAKDLDLDVEGVDPTKESVPQAEDPDAYDEGAASDDEQAVPEDDTSDIIADIGGMADEDDFGEDNDGEE